MKKIGDIISEQLFLNAYHICQNYCKTERILDVNFRLLKDHFLKLTDAKVKTFYGNYVSTDLVYSLRELFSSDAVSIPRNLTGVREYRFFSMFSMILYNAVGLLFVDCCSQMIEQLNFSRKSVFAYYPTKFIRHGERWMARNDYKSEYNAFAGKLNTHIEPGDVVLKFDIGNYFGSVSHSKLVGLLRTCAPESALEKHNISKDSAGTLEFYLESMIQRKQGIPQGRKNFVSDYFGYLYLIPFDMNVPSLAKSKSLRFKSAIRYVDDIYLILKASEGVSKKEIYRELLTIEQAIASWFYKNWNLSVSPSKTVREIIRTPTKKVEFIKYSKKAVSDPDAARAEGEKVEVGVGSAEMEKQFEAFKGALEKFRFGEVDKFEFSFGNKEREGLKSILGERFQAFVLKGQNTSELRGILRQTDIDLTADHINILIALFLLKIKKDHSRPFYPFLEDFLIRLIDLGDKRHIHIMLAALAQGISPKQLTGPVRKFSEQLKADDYGKYLQCFFDSSCGDSDNPVYRRICLEHAGKKAARDTFLFPRSSSSKFSDYEILVQSVVRFFLDQQTLIQPLKDYVCERWKERWDLAFNHFHGLFHELCKLKFKLDDTATVKDVIRKLDHIGTDDELLLMKFYDRRNFNAVSHPSQKGRPSVKVSESDLIEYERRVLKIIVENLLE